MWRDLKTWGDYLYCINDQDGDGGAGLQILNLEELISGSNNPTYIENMSLGFETAHNLFIDENGVLYVFGANYGEGGALMYDLVANPENPPLLGIFDYYYLHDGMARGDTLWGGAIDDGVFSVVDVSDKQNPSIIGSHATPNNFSHNCWISDDGDYLFTTDEVSGAYVAAYDVSNLSDIEEVDRIQAWSPQTNVIPHNTHVDGDFIVTSYYTDGVSVVDVSNPSNMIEVGYYDTSEDYSGDGFHGAWGAYPWLPSGNILVTDIEAGLYVLEPKYSNASFLEGTVTDASTGAPISNAQIQMTGSNTINISDLGGHFETGVAIGGTYEITISSSGYNDLVQTVNLRGLGNGRTLTLVNGRRWVGGQPGTGIVDLNSIPTDLIERLEVITGGASSVYGSDAIAGVVNIILKDDFEGMSVEVMEGAYDAGDGETSLASVTFGAQFADGRGSSIFNIRTDEQGRVLARDRTPYTGRDIFHYGYYAEPYGVPSWYDFALDPGYSSFPPQGRFFVSGDNGNSAGMLTFDCSERDIDSVVKSDTVVPWGGSAACGFNRTHYRALEVPLDRYSVFNSTKSLFLSSC